MPSAIDAPRRPAPAPAPSEPKEADVRDVLVDALERELPDAVVMASRHLSAPLRRDYLGSVAGYVLRHAPVPVLVVPTLALPAPAKLPA